MTLEGASLINDTGGIIDLAGNFLLNGSAQVIVESGQVVETSQSLFNNRGGTVRKTDTGTAIINAEFGNVENGKVDLQSGTTIFTGGFAGISGTVTIGSGAVLDLRRGAQGEGDSFSSTEISGAGVFQTKGFTTTNSFVTLGMTEGGKAVIDGAILREDTLSGVTNTGQAEWRTGLLEGFVNRGNLVTTFVNTGGLSTKVMGNGFRNEGLFDIAAAVTVLVGKPADESDFVTNAGTINLCGTLAPQNADVSTRFLNASGGTLKVLAANETRAFNGIFDNKGVLEVGANTKFNLLNAVTP